MQTLSTMAFAMASANTVVEPPSDAHALANTAHGLHVLQLREHVSLWLIGWVGGAVLLGLHAARNGQQHHRKRGEAYGVTIAPTVLLQHAETCNSVGATLPAAVSP